MSKSKRNTVDPEPIVDQYGADAVRWFMLSDSPPERDLPWSEAGIEGSWRFVQRLWRLAAEEAERGSSTWLGDGEDPALDRKLHQTIAAVGANIEALAFNKAVANLYELDQCARKGAAVAVAEPGDRDPGPPGRADGAASRRGGLGRARPRRA